MTLAAIAGAAAPDLSLYLMAGTALFLMNVPPNVVFDELYFSPQWQAVFAVDNSFLVWGLGLALALWLKRPAWIAFAGAALLHLALDFPLHNDDARPHFWPVSDWVFQSPVSYWDRDHYANIVGPIEAILCLMLCVVLWRRFQGWIARGLIVATGALQIAPVFIWVFIFDG
ncbi:MAG: cobalamin biosynthesis protein CobQ [Pseudomonadota bacterium]